MDKLKLLSMLSLGQGTDHPHPDVKKVSLQETLVPCRSLKREVQRAAVIRELRASGVQVHKAVMDYQPGKLALYGAPVSTTKKIAPLHKPVPVVKGLRTETRRERVQRLQEKAHRLAQYEKRKWEARQNELVLKKKLEAAVQQAAETGQLPKESRFLSFKIDVPPTPSPLSSAGSEGSTFSCLEGCDEEYLNEPAPGHKPRRRKPRSNRSSGSSSPPSTDDESPNNGSMVIALSGPGIPPPPPQPEVPLWEEKEEEKKPEEAQPEAPAPEQKEESQPTASSAESNPQEDYTPSAPPMPDTTEGPVPSAPEPASLRALERDKLIESKARQRQEPRFKEASCKHMINCLPNKVNGDNTLYEAERHVIKPQTLKWGTGPELLVDEMLLARLRLEAAYSKRTTSLLLQLRLKAKQELRHYDTSRITPGELTQLLTETVGAAFVPSPAEQRVMNFLSNQKNKSVINAWNMFYEEGSIGFLAKAKLKTLARLHLL